MLLFVPGLYLYIPDPCRFTGLQHGNARDLHSQPGTAAGGRCPEVYRNHRHCYSADFGACKNQASRALRISRPPPFHPPPPLAAALNPCKKIQKRPQGSRSLCERCFGCSDRSRGSQGLLKQGAHTNSTMLMGRLRASLGPPRLDHDSPEEHPIKILGGLVSQALIWMEVV